MSSLKIVFGYKDCKGNLDFGSHDLQEFKGIESFDWIKNNPSEKSFLLDNIKEAELDIKEDPHDTKDGESMAYFCGLEQVEVYTKDRDIPSSLQDRPVYFYLKQVNE